MKHLKTNEILDRTIENAVVKANGGFAKLLVLAILAGGFVAAAGQGANMASFNLLNNPDTFGLGRCLSGLVFTSGLILIMLCGGELFTGNTLMITAVADKRISAGKMIRNLVIVYFGNMIGGILIAYMVSISGLFSGGAGLLGGVTVRIAANKCALPFVQALVLGILCNWIVCLAVWMATGAEDSAGKILAIFFPIWLFAMSGFEHCVANMYYIPAGIFAKGTEKFAELANVSSEVLAGLSWKGFFINNMIPVTIGNIIGGAVCVGMAYWFACRKAK